MYHVGETFHPGNWKYDYYALADMLKKHRGSENVITAKEVADFLGIGGRKNVDVQVKNILFRVMRHTRTPIISNRFGYFVPKDGVEMAEYIASMRARIKGIEERISIAAQLFYGESLTPPM